MIQQRFYRAYGPAHRLLRFLGANGGIYSSWLSPIFLAACDRIDILRDADVWLARDGALTLQAFFARIPTPADFQGKIYVDEELAGFVPRAWRPQIGTYRFGKIREAEPAGELEGWIVGVAARTYAGMSHVKRALSRIQSASPEISQWRITLETQDDFDERADLARFRGELALEIASRLGSKAQMARPEELTSVEDCSRIRVLDLSEKLLCADNSLVHHVVRGGGDLVGAPKIAVGPSCDQIAETDRRYGFALRHAIGELGLDLGAETNWSFSAGHTPSADLWPAELTAWTRLVLPRLNSTER
jgi:hypothetical protein